MIAPARAPLQALPAALTGAIALLSLPYLIIGVWLARVSGARSLAAFIASVALLTWLLALLVRNWRAFLLLQFPLLLLRIAFLACTLAFNAPLGELLAIVLATSRLLYAFSAQESVQFVGGLTANPLIGTSVMGISWPGASGADSYASRQFIPDQSPAVIAGGTLVSRSD